ncbi:MAG: hypothetical protein EI684_13850 [Candidatus Viridilinea halotolerans]|uniref:Uncharacterized protein n=1 Tax=Candidatus Viridilinea halotolerans TaxID=2491704 RepID=A0A426TWY0_9CHLR|nr:MAG: hypothetical protein EI684_13850 [Candidatus Viridilinea halotolerans]
MLRRLLPPLVHATSDDDALLAWRKHTSLLLLRLALLLGLPILLFDATTHWQFQRWPMLAANLGLVCLLLGLIAFPLIDYRLRSGSIVAMLLFNGLVGMSQYLSNKGEHRPHRSLLMAFQCRRADL